MGTLINGINGSFSGKVGNVVGSSWRGKNYVKAMPKISCKHAAPELAPQRMRSTKQLAQQAKFSLAVKFLQPVKDLLNIGFRQRHRPATGYNLAIKHVLQNVITGYYPDFIIDYSQAVFTKGLLGRPEFVEILADTGSLIIAWFANGYRPNSFWDDEVGILLYEPETNTYLKGPAGITRAEGIAFIPVPAAFEGKTLHTYLFCVSRDGQMSDTVYADPALNI